VLFRVPDWFRYEIAHALDRLRQERGTEGWREGLNRNPGWIALATVVTLLILGSVFWKLGRSSSGIPVLEGVYAWFYDLKSDRLFQATRNKLGPIAAPSGPLPSGEPAGVRAHVYSYVLDPNENELFVGFLDKPDPNANGGRPTWKRGDFDKWTRNRLIKRVEDETWVPVNSKAGQGILQELSRPDERGRTAQYQLP